MAADPTFTARDALAATTGLRDALGLEVEQFSAQAFIGMISDEIEQLRARGHDDATIAAMVSEITGKAISGDLIARFYASPSERGPRNEE